MKFHIHFSLIFFIATGCIANKSKSHNLEMVYLVYNAIQDSMRDPYAKDQWYLFDEYGINLPEETKVSGKNVKISFIDDGIDPDHEDLLGRIDASLSYNYISHSPGLSDISGGHATAIAGIVGANLNNGTGIRGIASDSQLLSFNVFQSGERESLLDAMERSISSADIINCSWGPADQTGKAMGPESEFKELINRGLATGRNGKGSIFVWSAGNGGKNDIDNSNYDGFANARGVLTVCSSGKDGKRTPYSEKGANILLCAPSRSSSGPGVTTTDGMGEKGVNRSDTFNDYNNKNYIGTFTGTSASAAMVSGVTALILETNPGLTYRDIFRILAKTARKIDPDDPEWEINGAGYHINHKYGFGLVDAKEAISLAKNHFIISKELEYVSDTRFVETTIPEDDSLLQDDINIPEPGFSHLLFAEISVITDGHPSWGELEIRLQSPSGTESVLTESHNCGSNCGDIDWTFGSVRHLDENPEGTWSLILRDMVPGNSGKLKSWKLKLYGYN